MPRFFKYYLLLSSVFSESITIKGGFKGFSSNVSGTKGEVGHPGPTGPPGPRGERDLNLHPRYYKLEKKETFEAIPRMETIYNAHDY